MENLQHIDYIAIDGNTWLYPPGNKTDTTIDINMTTPEFKAWISQNITDNLDLHLELFKKTNIICIFFDGFPTVAKMIAQKYRRLEKSLSNRILVSNFNEMMNIKEYYKVVWSHLNKRGIPVKTRVRDGIPVKVIQKQIGEGENQMFSYLMKELYPKETIYTFSDIINEDGSTNEHFKPKVPETQNVVVISSDSDCLLLSMIFYLRIKKLHNVITTIDNEHFIHMNDMFAKFVTPGTKPVNDLDKIYNMILMCLAMGNDILPSRIQFKEDIWNELLHPNKLVSFGKAEVYFGTDLNKHSSGEADLSKTELSSSSKPEESKYHSSIGKPHMKYIKSIESVVNDFERKYPNLEIADGTSDFVSREKAEEFENVKAFAYCHMLWYSLNYYFAPFYPTINETIYKLCWWYPYRTLPIDFEYNLETIRISGLMLCLFNNMKGLEYNPTNHYNFMIPNESTKDIYLFPKKVPVPYIPISHMHIFNDSASVKLLDRKDGHRLTVITHTLNDVLDFNLPDKAF